MKCAKKSSVGSTPGKLLVQMGSQAGSSEHVLHSFVGMLTNTNNNMVTLCFERLYLHNNMTYTRLWQLCRSLKKYPLGTLYPQHSTTALPTWKKRICVSECSLLALFCPLQRCNLIPAYLYLQQRLCCWSTAPPLSILYHFACWSRHRNHYSSLWWL